MEKIDGSPKAEEKKKSVTQSTSNVNTLYFSKNPRNSQITFAVPQETKNILAQITRSFLEKAGREKERKELFTEDDKKQFRVEDWNERFNLIVCGKVINEFATLIKDVLKKIYNWTLKDKMSTFYIIKNNTYVTTYVSLSGSGDASRTEKYQEKLRKTKNVTFIPFREEKSEKEFMQGKDDILDRKYVFIRFLIAGIDWVNRENDGKFFEEFNLNNNEKNHLQVIRQLHQGDSLKQIYQDYRSKNSNPISKMELLFSMFLHVDVILSEEPLLKGDIEYLDKNGTPTTGTIQSSLGSAYAQKYAAYLEKIDDADGYKTRMRELWDHLEQFTSFQISHKLSHCAETNLLAYLRINPGILKQPGNHYIFSIQLKDDKNVLISSPCEVCSVNLPQTFKQLLNTTYGYTSHSSSGYIPIVTLTKDEIKKHNDYLEKAANFEKLEKEKKSSDLAVAEKKEDKKEDKKEEKKEKKAAECKEINVPHTISNKKLHLLLVQKGFFKEQEETKEKKKIPKSKIEKKSYAKSAIAESKKEYRDFVQDTLPHNDMKLNFR